MANKQRQLELPGFDAFYSLEITATNKHKYKVLDKSYITQEIYTN